MDIDITEGQTQHPVLLGRNGWMRFKSPDHQSLPRSPRKGRLIVKSTQANADDVGPSSFTYDLDIQVHCNRFELVSHLAASINLSDSP